MQTEELIKKYLEQVGILEDEDILLAILYGSRIYGTAKDTSDLDVLLVTSSFGHFRESMLIDTIPVEITSMSLEKTDELVAYAYFTNNMYFESIFENGRVIKNEFGTLEMLQSLMNSLHGKKKEQKEIIFKEGVKIYDRLTKYYEKGIESQCNYYVLLDLLRNSYQHIHNYSTINPAKLYSLYTDTDYAKKVYKLHLPNEEYRQKFLNAITNSEKDMQEYYLSYFLDCIAYQEEKFAESSFVEEKIVDKQQIMRIMIALHKLVERTIAMLLALHPASDYVYNILLDRLRRTYLQLHDEGYSSFYEQYKYALVCSSEKRVLYIYQLFSMVEKSYKMDYNVYHYRLK